MNRESKDKWNETGRIWEEDHAWLDETQRAQCTRAHDSDMFQSPIPTRMISNGEYMPPPQTNQQKQVEERIKELSNTASKKLGMDRRRFLASTGGMAAAFLAMNEVFGRFFNVDPIEMFEPEAYAQAGTPRDLFVFDDQLHMVTEGAEARLQQHLRSQRPHECGAGASGDRTSSGFAESGERLAESQLHHVSRMHSAGLLHV